LIGVVSNHPAVQLPDEQERLDEGSLADLGAGFLVHCWLLSMGCFSLAEIGFLNNQNARVCAWRVNINSFCPSRLGMGLLTWRF